MKRSIVLYLLILAVLVNLFTYMYYSKQLDFDQKQFAKTKKQEKDSIKMLTGKLSDANHFSLEENQNAQDYFENKTTGKYISQDKLIPMVKDKLLDFNANPNGNPYVGFDKMNDKKFVINKVKFLNHRWIIADFNNGEMWGEVIIKYFVNDDNTVSFETAETLVYPKS